MININLKEVAQQKGHTLTDIANATGISMNTLSVMGRGESNGIKFATLEKICNFLGVTPNDLMGYDSNSLILTLAEQPNSDHGYSAAAFTQTEFAHLNRKTLNYDPQELTRPLTVYVQKPAFNSAEYFLFIGAPHNATEISYMWLSALTSKQQENLIQQAFTSLHLNAYKSENSRVVSVFAQLDHTARIYEFSVAEDQTLTPA